MDAFLCGFRLTSSAMVQLTLTGFPLKNSIHCMSHTRLRMLYSTAKVRLQKKRRLVDNERGLVADDQ